MSGFFKIKVLLIGALLASPPVAAWMIRGSDQNAREAMVQPLEVESPAPGPVQAAPVKVAVEVVSKGSAPQWVYIEVPAQAIPEPGSLTLVAAAGLLLLRRRRPAAQ
ncbi:MAG: PEP-CTERM sorting domain-containing protein [Akkermansiaceae bacterium]|nr:PEP-CTERM sorting domain-containing protein [Akkermansiaceae bacterium]